MIRIALAGNPNSGKTTLFNSLTGLTGHVGNWPGVTVDKLEGLYQKCEEPISIVDLPGIYSLAPYSCEEVIARNFIFDEKPDCIINVVDATNLERNLYLTTQLLEIDVPIVIALNMIDILEKAGEMVDIQKIVDTFKIPVIPLSALKQDNIDCLMQKAYEESKKERVGASILEKSPIEHLIKDCQIAFEALGVHHPLFHAVKLVELDELEIKDHPDLANTVQKYKEHNKDAMDPVFKDDYEAMIADSRYKFIESNFGKKEEKITSKNAIKQKNSQGLSMKIDKILTNKWVGIPIFLLLMFLVFHFTFSTNLFWLGSLINKPFLDGAANEGSFASYFVGALWDETGIKSLGVMVQNLLTGVTDWITDSLRAALSESAPWVSGLVCDGILGGVFSVLSFLPQVLLLFLFFSIMEDTGYMARIAFILDRPFRVLGLSGKSVLPLIMGFGCSVPAMANTRALPSEEEKVSTIRVIPFFACGAKLPILVAIGGGIISYFHVGHPDLITYSLYLIGVIVAIISLVLTRGIKAQNTSNPFIMELPSYHMPQFKSLMALLWDKLKHFIQKTFTIILASTIFIWVLSHFGWNVDKGSFGFLEDKMMSTSLLGYVAKGLQWLFTPLGFGSQLNENGWVFVVSSLIGLVAKENVVATFGTMGACLNASFVLSSELEGIDATVQMINATGISVAGLLAFAVFNMVTIPCISAVATAKAELPKGRFVKTILFWLLVSFLASSAVYTIFEFVWPVAIWSGLLIAALLLIRLKNKKKPQEASHD